MWFCSTICGLAAQKAISSANSPLSIDTQEIESRLSNKIEESRAEQNEFRQVILEKLANLETNIQNQKTHIEQVPTQVARTWSHVVAGTTENQDQPGIPPCS